MKKNRKSRLGGAVYILPNLITTGNLFFGFFSIVKALQGQLVWAAWSVLLAAVFDVLDGRVARMTGGTSEFGVQYDSLCDLVSFGLAPSFLVYQYGLSGMGRVGWIACFVFLACGALRLARFNVQSSIGKANGNFTGLPIPMAAAVITTFVIASLDLQNMEATHWGWEILKASIGHPDYSKYILLASAPLLGILMVSNIGFRSHKNFAIRGVNPFKMLVGAVVLLGLVALHPELLGFLAAAGYALSGPIESVIGGNQALEDDDIFGAEEEDLEDDPS